MGGSHPALIICGFVQLFGWVFLTVLSQQFAYDISNDAMPTWTFVLVEIGLGIALLASIWTGKKQISVPVILIFAALIRLVAIFGEPIHESDFYRYLWDGKSAKIGINPYRFEPGALYLLENGIESDFKDEQTGVTWRGRKFDASEKGLLNRLRDLRDENPVLFRRISHPAVTTIYPPTAQWLFLISDSVIGLKTIIVLFDIGVVCLVLLLLRSLKRPLHWALLYAWNPLPVKEFANSAHYDSAVIFFMLLAVWLAMAKPKSVAAISAPLAVATLMKYFAVLLLPIILFRYSWKKILIGAVTFSGIVLLSFLPYFYWNDAGAADVFRGLGTYTQHWIYSPGLFDLINQVVSFETAKLIGAVLLAIIVFVVSFFSKLDLPRKCFLAVSALFLLSPTAFPWYFCWVLAFVPFQNRYSWYLFSLLVPLNYLDFHSAGNIPLANQMWGPFFATQVLSWGIFSIAWISESLHRHFR